MWKWKIAGWVALLALVIGGTLWRIDACGCYPPTTSSQWGILSFRIATGALMCDLILWDLQKALKSARVPR